MARGCSRTVAQMFAQLAGALRVAALGMVLAAIGALAPLPTAQASPAVHFSGASEQILQSLLTSTADDSAGSRAARSDLLSRQFIGTPYGAHTLIGSASVPEQLVIDVEKVDCFTYADYVEALKRSHTRDEFIANLIDVRYKVGVVAFETRKHFFTDWSAASPPVATDVTAELSGNAISSPKNLNSKDSGGTYLPGLPVVARTVTYIPSDQVDADVIGRLRTGDYIGAYAEDGGLDVTHVGIFVSTPDGPVFRHASSLGAEVVDTPLPDYLQTVPGIVVLRPVA
jgi:Protein of unknown function (DUF1460)